MSKTSLGTFRNLLRTVTKIHPRNTSSWKANVREQFKSTTYRPEDELVAKEYHYMLKSILHQNKLFEDYGIGKRVDEKERIQQMAKRVGLSLEKFDTEAHREKMDQKLQQMLKEQASSTNKE